MDILHKTKLEDDPKKIIFGSMHFLDKSQPQGLTGSPKGVCFQVRRIKIVNLGVLNKKNLKVTQKHSLLDLCNFLIQSSPESVPARENPIKRMHFQVCKINARNLGGDHQTFTFAVGLMKVCIFHN